MEKTIMYWGNKPITILHNPELINKARNIKKEFSPEFRDWWIKFKAQDSGLALHDENEWWYKPAMELRYPGIVFQK